jgi:hypothetical protein
MGIFGLKRIVVFGDPKTFGRLIQRRDAMDAEKKNDAAHLKLCTAIV